MHETIKKHDYSFDILRILACFLVIVNHTNSEVFLNMEPCATWALSVGYFYFSKIAVPIFIMISGALLFKREYTYRELFSKIFKTLAVLVLFSFYVYVELEGNAINLKEFLFTIIEAPIMTSYWYLYLMLGMYMILPFLYKIIHAMKKADWMYFLIGWFFFSGICPMLVRYEIIPTITFWFDLQIMSDFIGYLFVGYYITHLKVSRSFLNKVMIASVFILPCIVGISIMSSVYELQMWNQLYLMLDNVYYATTATSSILIFFCVHHYFKDKNFDGFFGRALQGISSTTFGIYVLHMIYFSKLMYVRYDLLYFNNQLLSVILFEIFLFAFCSLAAFCIKKVPVFKQIL